MRDGAGDASRRDVHRTSVAPVDDDTGALHGQQFRHGEADAA
ncbi:hypothetical protein [Mycobacterium sp. URHB0021]|jgi:hypothetical protein